MQELLILCALEEEFSKEDNPYAESIFYTGVGKVNSCIAAIELIKEKKPTLVISVGTAGSCRIDISLTIQTKNPKGIGKTIYRMESLSF